MYAARPGNRTLTGWLKSALLGATLALVGATQAQTTLISPTGDGGFENGATFAANGWSLDNGSATNQWYLGPFAITGMTNTVAYVSNDGGVNNNFTNTAPSVVHFWRDVTFPAGETSITLSFSWRAQGETSSWDAIMVSFAPTSYTPVAGTTSIGTGGLSAPAVTAAQYWLQSTTQTATLNIPGNLIGNCSGPSTVRIIFTWKSDTSGGTNPAGSVDGISLVSQTPPVPPIPSAGGVFTIDNTLPTGGANYASFTEAINALNQNGCPYTGSVVFNVTAGQTFAENPPAIIANGSVGFPITFQRAGVGANPVITPSGGNGATTALDFGLGVYGGDYITFNGIDVNSSANTNVEFGYYLRNANAADGASNITVKNCSVTLNQGNASCVGILCTSSTAGGGFTPTAAAGANSNCKFYNVNVQSCVQGVNFVNGTTTFPSIGNELGVEGGGTTTIGAPYVGVPTGSIGNTTAATFGVQMSSQSGFKINGCTIQNVTTTTTGLIRGILVANAMGASEITNNVIRGIRRTSTTSTAEVSGINVSFLTTAGPTQSVLIANNMVSDITCAYTGAATATRIQRGITLLTGSVTSSYNVFHNSVSIDGSGSPNASNICIEAGSAVTPIFNIRNNILANYTGAQAGVAKHYCIRSQGVSQLGNAASNTNYNDYYIADATNGFVGLTSTTDRVDRAAWTAALTTNPGTDANSISVNPPFVNNATDLHLTAASVTTVESGGVANTGVLVDIDGDARPSGGTAVAPDLGADEFNGTNPDACTGVPVAGTISGTSPLCAGNGATLTLGGSSTGVGISYQWASATTPGGPYTNLGTALTQATGALTTTTYYIVTVTCAVGGSSSATPEFTLTVNPTPTASATSNSPICEGDDLNLNGSTDIGLTFNWNGPNGFTSGLEDPSILAATPAASGTYSFTATSNLGCTSTVATTSVVVNVNPVITGISATPALICSGSSSSLLVTTPTASGYCATVTFTFNVEAISNVTFAGINNNSACAVGGGAGGAIEDFTSIFGNVVAGGVYPISISGHTDGNFTTFMTAFFDWDQNGTFETAVPIGSITNTACVLTATNNITIPAGAFNGTTRMRILKNYNASPLDPCGTYGYGQAEDYSLNVTGGVEPYTYSWSPTTFLNNPAIANPTASAVTSTTTYTATVTNAAGCTATDDVTVTVGPASAPTVSISAAGATVFCAGGSVQLNSSVSDGCAPYTYVWSDGTTTVGGNTPTLMVTTSGTYSLTVLDQFLSAGLSNTIIVTVNPLPVVSVAPTSAVYCTPGPAITLTASGADTYGWAPAAGLSATTGNIVDATPASATTYTVTGTENVNGCVNSATVNITTGTTPTLEFVTATPSSVCIGDNSSLAIGASLPQSFTYCSLSSTNGTGSGDFCSLVQIPGTTLNNATGASGSPYYTHYPAAGSTTATLTAGSNYTINLVAGTYTINDFAVWIDYNQNGVFDEPAEKLGQINDQGAQPTIGNIPFTVPAGAKNGPTRMRVREADQGSTSMPACGALTWGETEDYTITIVGGVPAFSGTYSWSPTTFLNNPSSATPTAVAMTSTTTYTATAIAATGCTVSGSVTVTVNPLPVVTCGGPYGPYCNVDAPVALNGSPVGGTWSGAGIVGTSFDPALAGAGTFALTYTYTDGNGCTSECGVSVTVNQATPWYADQDGDGSGDPNNMVMACGQPVGYVANTNDLCPFDPSKIAPGQCGCGTPDIDTDGDGTANCVDLCPNDPNKVSPGFCGCGVADVDSDMDGLVDCLDGCPTDPTKTSPGQCGCGVPDIDTDSDGTADCIDLCPLDPTKITPGSCGCGNPEPGQSCDDGNPGTVGDVVDASCNCVGVPLACANNAVVLTLVTDAFGNETSWDIIPAGGGSPVCSGSGLPNNTVVQASCCLPNGCYDLRVFDSWGDGMCCAYGDGGYVLRTGNNQRIIDNLDDGLFSFVSQAATGFCVPIGGDAFVAGSCDQESLLGSAVLQAVENPLVTSNYLPSSTNTGYQYWFFNPDGGYSRRVFLSHAAPGSGAPVGTSNPLKASYIRLSEIAVNPVPTFTLLNIRVRSRVNGIYAEFGPACRMKIDPSAGCSTTQLTTIANPVISCGATNVTLNGSPTSNIYATPVALANRYQFEFSRPGYLRRAASPVNGLTLDIWSTNPLQCGTTYDVRVRVSFDGGLTYCNWGPVCTISTISCAPAAQGRDLVYNTSGMELTVYPNPTRGEQVFVRLTGLPESEQTVTIEVIDLYGKRVAAQTHQVSALLNTDLNLGSDLASGMYTVTVTTNEGVLTQRLVVSR